MAAAMSWQIAWSIVLAANLIVPLRLAADLTGGAGRWYGVACAIALYWALGLRVCACSRRAAVTLVVGGGLVAVTQCYPAVQIIAGLVSLFLWSEISGAGAAKRLTALGGFVMTLLTGGLLLAVAVSAGAVAQLTTNRFDETPADGGPVWRVSGIERATGQLVTRDFQAEECERATAMAREAGIEVKTVRKLPGAHEP